MFNYSLFSKLLSNRKIYTESFIKNEIAKRLIKRLEFIKIEPKNIFVDGYIDENYLKLLKELFPKSRFTAEIEHKQKYDLIISNTVIHLNDSIIDSLDSYYELLSDDGIMIFSSFGDKTFATLIKAFEKIDNKPHTNKMIDLMSWGTTLQNSKFNNPAIESDLITFTYERLETLFNDIIELNEPLADTKMRNGLTGKNVFNKLKQELINSPILEIEALYAYVERKENKISSKPLNDRVSLDDLKKQIAEFKSNNK